MATPRKTAPSSFHVTKTMVWIFLIGYSAFLVGRSTYQNYKLNRDITTYKEQIATLERSNSLNKLALVYYQSQAFKEVAAREHLGLKGVNEKVFALPAAKTEAALSVATDDVVAEAESAPVNLAPYQAWLNLFFGK